MKIEESRLRHLIRQISSNPYMPSQDQLVQLLSIALTMVLMAYLGPIAGPSAGLVSAVVKQVIPVFVAAMVSYVNGGDDPDVDALSSKLIDAQIADVALSPVAAPTSIPRTIL